MSEDISEFDPIPVTKPDTVTASTQLDSDSSLISLDDTMDGETTTSEASPVTTTVASTIAESRNTQTGTLPKTTMSSNVQGDEKQDRFRFLKNSISSFKGQITMSIKSFENRVDKVKKYDKEFLESELTDLNKIRLMIRERYREFIDLAMEKGEMVNTRGIAWDKEQEIEEERISKQEQKIGQLLQELNVDKKSPTLSAPQVPVTSSKLSFGTSVVSSSNWSATGTGSTRTSTNQPSSYSYVSMAEMKAKTTAAPINLLTGLQSSDFFRVPFQDTPDKGSTSQAVSTVSAFSKPSTQVTMNTTQAVSTVSAFSKPYTVSFQGIPASTLISSASSTTPTTTSAVASVPLSQLSRSTTSGTTAASAVNATPQSATDSPLLVDINATQDTPPTPKFPWEDPNLGPDPINIPRLPSKAFLSEAERMKQSCLFGPNPRVLGVNAAEQKHLDSVYETTLKKLPNLELTKFSGPNDDYERWKDHFEKIIGRHLSIDPLTKLSYLQKSLAGEAKRNVMSYLSGVNGDKCYEKAMRMLDKFYGGEIEQQQKAQNRFIQMAPLKDTSLQELNRVYLVISNLISFHQDHGNTYIVDNCGSGDYRDARKKLGPFVKEYDRWCMERQETLNLQSLEKWLDIMSTSARLSHTLDGAQIDSEDDGTTNYGQQRQKKRYDKGKSKSQSPPKREIYDEKNKSKTPPKRYPKKENFTKEKETPRGSQDKAKCGYCGMDNHMTWKCFRFRKLSVQDRWSFIKEKNLCAMCFNERHGKCDRMDPCKKCGKYQNIMLHDDSPKPPFKSHTATESRESTSPNKKEAKAKSEQANHGRSGRAAIQMGSIDIHVRGKKMTGNILLDLGADHTSIREDTAQQMNMKTIQGPRGEDAIRHGGKEDNRSGKSTRGASDLRTSVQPSHGEAWCQEE